jgi:MFS family permease
MMLAKFGARVWIARILLTWGAVSVLTAFVQNSTQLYILRFLLGVAEADFLRLCRQRAVLERHGVSLRYGQGGAKAGSGSLILAGHVYWFQPRF